MTTLTLKEVKQKLHVDSYSLKNDIYTVRKGFYYKMGKSTKDLENKVLEAFPNAKIIDSGEIDKPFCGGASVANNSHWYVKFMLPE
jgi:hypothetical protein